jgi:Fe(3+) dicitrate transport protein
MLYKAFKIFFVLLTPLAAMAQVRLEGKVFSAEDSTHVRACLVHLDNGKYSTTTNQDGYFYFGAVEPGTHVLHFTNADYKYRSQSVVVSNEPVAIVVYLEPRLETLEEITVTDASQGFGFTRLRSVENLGIYEGKKSEVIIPEQLVANLAANNARQVYARVAGLNIWENDGAGIQLSIGGRGLDPNRTSNFNVRQNGYDISADALGYPESYYTPPVEGVGKIQIVRGAASLQYGTQFGGLINFVMKKPAEGTPLEIVARQSGGSYGFYNTFTSVSGTDKKLGYYAFYQYKRGDGWRANAAFDNQTAYAHVQYALREHTKIGLDVTHMDYLTQQPGGLTQDMFEDDPRQSNRRRNWFKVNWNLLALHIDHRFNQRSEMNIRLFGLSAYRYSVGFRPNRVATVDDNSERDLIKGNFENWGAEARYLRHLEIGKRPVAWLTGVRYYHGYNRSRQGVGTTGAGADFTFVNPDTYITYDYRFPNRNAAAFSEVAIYLHEKFSVTPGVRYEYINTVGDGYYGTIYRDLAGNVIEITRTNERRTDKRQFVLGGIGLSYKPVPALDVYANLSQNYRSITFSDMRISNPSSVIDPDLRDEKGYSFDIGVRSDQTSGYSFDVSYFYLNYDNRIGEVQFYDENNRVLRRRGNIGQAIIQGVEAYGEADVMTWLNRATSVSAVVFVNMATIVSEYKKSEDAGVVGNQVEFVPALNLKTGVRAGFRKWKASLQFMYLSDQYTDATNAKEGGVAEVVGLIPAYQVLDLSISFQHKQWRVEGTVNNVTDEMYFTRRATGYPGPGILPSDGRTFYVTLEYRWRSRNSR